MSQTTRILAALKRGKRLTPLNAQIAFGTMRLGARIWELRRAGHEINRRMIEVGDGKHVAEYRLLRAAS